MNQSACVRLTTSLERRNVCSLLVNASSRPEWELQVARPGNMSHLLPSHCIHPFSVTVLSTGIYLAARYPFHIY